MEENDSKFKKYAFGWVSFFLGLAGMFGLIWGIFSYINAPTNKFALEIQQIKSNMESQQKLGDQLTKIQQNDLHTIQLKVDEISKQQIEILQVIARIETLLKMNK